MIVLIFLLEQIELYLVFPMKESIQYTFNKKRALKRDPE